MIGIGGTHNFKMTALVRGVLWTFEGATKMKGRVVDEVDVDVRRLVVLAILRGTVDQILEATHAKNWPSGSRSPAISLFTRRSRASDMMERETGLRNWM